MSPTSPQGSLEISISWSRNRSQAPPIWPRKVSFAQGEFAFISEAARRLRDPLAPKPLTVQGFIVTLQAEASLFVNFAGRVVVRTELAGKAARLWFWLDRDNYARACDAHRDQLRVSVRGLLHRDPQAKMFELLEPQDFRVLGRESAATSSGESHCS